MAIDFGVSAAKHFRYEQEGIARSHTGTTAASCQESHEERARTLLEVPGRGRNPAYEWQSVFWLQCGERFVWNDELRRAHGDFLRGGATGAKD